MDTTSRIIITVIFMLQTGFSWILFDIALRNHYKGKVILGVLFATMVLASIFSYTTCIELARLQEKCIQAGVAKRVEVTTTTSELKFSFENKAEELKNEKD